jgi:tetratricopeptide (TPR) repeat protein
MNRFLFIACLVLAFSSIKAQSDLQKGIDFFDKRAEKHEGLKVDSVNINKAIDSFHKALHVKADNERAYDYLLLSYYYKGAFVVRTKADQKQAYLKGKILGEEAIKKYPENKAILLWYIANFSKYGEANGIVASAKDGLADKIKMYSERLFEMDSTFADGAPHKLLGVINYKVPNIPLLISWPSKKVAEYHLKKALVVNPKSISNLYFYAEFLVEVKRHAEAKVILNKVINAKPRLDAIIEDLYDIDQAKKLLDKLEG